MSRPTVVALPARSETAAPATPRPATTAGLAEAVDAIEQAARDAGVWYVDVQVQTALARDLIAAVSTLTLGDQPTVAEVHLLRERRIVLDALRDLVIRHARAARR